MFISTVNAKHKNKNHWQLLFGLIINVGARVLG